MNDELRELLQLFDPVKRFYARLDRGAIDFDRPKTEIARLTKALDSASEFMDGARVARQLAQLVGRLPSFDVKTFIGTLPRSEGARVQLLCDYLDDVERQVPMLTSTVYAGSLLPTLGFLEHWMTTEARLAAAAAARGEARVGRLRSLADFLEVVYREFVTVLYELECVRERRLVHRGLDFGNLVETVAAWTRNSLPGVVDRDAARIRNAAAHYHWVYDPATELLCLHNSNKQGRITWQANFRLGELYRRLRDMYLALGQLAAALLWRSSVASLEMFRVLPLSHILEPALPSALPELDEQSRTAITARFGPVQSHVVSACWTSRRAERDAAASTAKRLLAVPSVAGTR